MGTKKITKRRTYYVQTCSDCGNEFEVSKDDKDTVCYVCATKRAYDKALADGQFLIGAEIISLIPRYSGHRTDIYELDSLRVRTKEGKVIEFAAAGWDERYIDWDEIE